VRTKYFYEKSTCHLGCVKKINFGAKTKAFCGTCFFFLTSTTKKYQFFVKLGKRHRLRKCTCEFFCWNFLTTRKYVFFCEKGSIYTREVNWIFKESRPTNWNKNIIPPMHNLTGKSTYSKPYGNKTIGKSSCVRFFYSTTLFYICFMILERDKQEHRRLNSTEAPTLD
jgi:hypothetical protein